MTQRTDKAVIRDAERFNATYRDLKRFLRSKGIRSLKSPKAQAAIYRASVHLPSKGEGRA